MIGDRRQEHIAYTSNDSFSSAEPLPPPLSFESLLLVDAIARRGSFAGAAEELGRAPSAVTYAARKLEDELDVLLFDRRGYRARLTAAGEELLREGRHLLAAAEDLRRRVQRVAKGWERELRIALDSVLPFERLLPLLASFCGAAPTQLRISHEVLGGTWDALASDRCDLAIGASAVGATVGHGAGYRTRRLGEVQFVFAVAPAHALSAATAPLDASQLRAHRQIVVGDTSQRLAPRTAGLLGTAETITVASMADKIAAQVAGLGVGYVPLHLVRGHLARGDLVVKRTEAEREHGNRAPLYAAWRTDARGKAIGWWLARLGEPAVQSALLS
jgi:DNA-binding transcriptional LysR family regulator